LAANADGVEMVEMRIGSTADIDTDLCSQYMVARMARMKTINTPMVTSMAMSDMFDVTGALDNKFL